MKKVMVGVGLAWCLMGSSVWAQDAAWQSSYQLETAGKFQDALMMMDSLSANSADAELRQLRRAWLLYRMGKWDASIAEYRKAIERNNRSVDARVGELLPLLAAQRWREAEQGARSVLEMAPGNYTALLRMAVAQEGQRDWANMLKTASTLVMHYPTDYLSYLYLARAHAWMGKRGEASAAYAAVLLRYPGYLEAKAYLEKK